MTDPRQLHLDKIAEARQGNQPSSVRAAFADALREMPDDPVVLATWAEYQFAEGEEAAGRNAILKAYSRVPAGQHHLKMALCDKMYEMGLKQQAAQALPELVPEERTVETLARIKILRTKRDEIGIRQACKHLIATADLPARRWRQISELALKSNQPTVAIEAFLKCLQQEGAKPADLARLVNLHIENDDLDSAWNVLQAAPDILLKQPAMLAAYAACLRKRGQTQEAIATYQKLLDTPVSRTSAWGGLANLAAKEDLPDLVERCEAVLEGDQLDSTEAVLIRFALANMQDRLKRTRQAFENYQIANDRLQKAFSAQGTVYNRERHKKGFDLITRWFPAEAFKPRKADVTGDRPLFIVGMPRSGTSLLERIIASMPNVQAGGECKALPHVSGEHHQRVLRGKSPAPAELDAAGWKVFADDYWALSRVRGQNVTDKLPQNYRNLGWAMNMFPAAPIIYLKRDPRDIGWSIYKRAFRSGFSYAVNLEDIAHAINECEAYMAHWTSVAPDRILTVQYEELVQNPEPVTRQIADFCGLEWTEACLSPEKLDIPSFTISEQQVRQPINAKGLGRWREYEEFLQPMITALDGYGLLP